MSVQNPGHSIMSISFSPDGQIFAAAGTIKDVFIYDSVSSISNKCITEKNLNPFHALPAPML